MKVAKFSPLIFHLWYDMYVRNPNKEVGHPPDAAFFFSLVVTLRPSLAFRHVIDEVALASPHGFVLWAKHRPNGNQCPPSRNLMVCSSNVALHI